MVKVIKESISGKDSTQTALQVNSDSTQEAGGWDRQRIISALVKEARVPADKAEQVALQAEEVIFSSKLKEVPTSLVREVVNAKLLEAGLGARLKKTGLVGLPIYNVGGLLTKHNKENANVRHSPESIGLYLSESILRQYALAAIFSPDVAEAHFNGDIHIHDLGLAAVRPYCSGQNVAFVAKYGLSGPVYVNPSKPARDLFVLIDHLKEFTSMLQGNFAGAIGWDTVNTVLGPFCYGQSEKKIVQGAEHLVYGMSQLLGTRGGQVAFTDLNIYWEIPGRIKGAPAIGPGGHFMWGSGSKHDGTFKITELKDSEAEVEKMPRYCDGQDGVLTYEAFSDEAQAFARALLKVYRRGDANGAPFHFPKILIHVTEDAWKTPGWKDFLLEACEVAAEKGSPYFVMDRNENKISQCCRLSLSLDSDDLELSSTQPWRIRFSAMQNVSLNLPRIALKAAREKDPWKAVGKELDRLISLSIQAHREKTKHIKSLLDLGDDGPLRALAVNLDGDPYYKLDKATYLIGIVGLNDAAKALTGYDMHESAKSYEAGLRIMAELYTRCQKQSDLKIAIEQTPAESTAYRFAKLDVKDFPEAANIVKGDLKSGSVYYTNSSYFAPAAPMGEKSSVRS